MTRATTLRPSQGGAAGSSGAAGSLQGGNAGSAGTAGGAAGNAGTAGDASGGAAGNAGNAAGGASGNAGAAGSGTPTKWLMGYYPGYQRDDMPPEQVPFDRMTHIAVGAALPNTDGTLDTTFYLDATQGPALADDLTTRAHTAGRKAVLMVGGAGTYDGFASSSNASNRATFVSNLVAFAKAHGFDGLDLDWEPLATSDLPALDALAKALRAAWPQVILTVPVGTININYETVDASWGAISSSFDQINLMSYSMAGAYEGWQSWHHSPMDGASPTTPTSIKSSVQAWLAAGVPASKLGIGAGFYGLCYTSPVTGPKQALNGANSIADDNGLSYRALMSSYYSANERHWDDTALSPYLSFTSPKGQHACTYLSYTDEQSLQEQASYVHQANLGGVIVWTINEGHLESGADRDPLLTALYGGLN